MANQRDGISWCDETWNLTRGCQRVSEGCRNCWAMKQANRMKGKRRKPGPYHDLVRLSDEGPVWTGRARFVPEALEHPLRWRKPRRIAVSLMGDLFHEDITNEQIAAVFGVIAATPNHTYLVLTKRPERMAEWFRWIESPKHATCGGWAVSTSETCQCYVVNGQGLRLDCFEQAESWPLANVWLGISAEDQRTLAKRLPHLLATPAVCRWVSLEPLLGPVQLDHVDTEFYARVDDYYVVDALTGRNRDMGRPCADVPHLDWVVAGGESGQRARGANVEWFRTLRQACSLHGIPFHLKQLGAKPFTQPNGRDLHQRPYPVSDSHGGVMDDWPPDLRVQEWPEVAGA